MAGKTDYLRNKQIDNDFRGVAYTPPATMYVALFVATAGQSPRSTAVTLGQTTVPATLNGHMYRCTTAGTTGSGEPTWPTTNNGTVTDGTAVWTEAYANFKGNSNLTEVSGGSYARVAITSGTTQWASTGGATTTTNPSAGSTGTTSNNAAVTFPTPSGAWGLVVFSGLFDASTSGNLLYYGAETVALNVTGSSTPFSFPISAFTYQVDN